MAKQRAPLEFNSLAGGLITEASPLTFPDSASIDEVNFELRSDGTRRRRQGFELETGFTQYDLEQQYATGGPTVVSSFLWRNVNGRADVEYAVIQTDNKIHIYKTSEATLSGGKVGTETLDTVFNGNIYGFANIDGALVVVTGGANVYTVTANTSVPSSPSFSLGSERLTIRDLFGIDILYDRSVEDGSVGPDLINLSDPEYVSKRPLEEGLPNPEGDPIVIEYTSDGTKDFDQVTDTAYGRLATEAGGPQDSFVISPATYSGFKLKTWSTVRILGPDDFTLNIHFDQSTGVPTFETLAVHDNRTGSDYVLTRHSGDSYRYIVDVSEADFDTWRADVPNGASFSMVGTLEATVYNYNLRNQSFGVKRLPKTGDTLVDPITSFTTAAGGKLPSMSDTIISTLYPNIDEGNKTADRFHAEDLVSNPLGSAPAPKGHFIIDALDRADSRVERWAELLADQDLSEAELGTMPKDATPGGPLAVAEWGGRLWYGGFSEEGSESVEGATRLSSYLLFSQLANSKSVLTRCYQVGDPTSVEEPELLDTDGGFLSLDGAYSIQRLVPLGNSLLAFSENGVWAVSGFDGNYFSPTSPRVQKVTDKGSTSPGAIVVIDTSVIYWARDGIYLIKLSDLNGYEVTSLTDKTIQALYSDISFTDKREAKGSYDTYSSEVTWVYHNTVGRTNQTELLVMKTITGAFTKYILGEGDSNRTLVGHVTIPPYTVDALDDIITVGSITVTAGGVDVTIPTGVINPRTSTSKGIVISDVGGSSNLSFGGITNAEFLDWGEEDAAAYIVTGYVSGGDFQRHKTAPYITFHFEKTEGSFSCPIDADNQSSCLVQAQWDWADSVNSGRWSRVFQAYRFRKHYVPSALDDNFDNGFATVVTKNKIRGKGRVLSLKLATEEAKDCRIIGWSTIIEVNPNV